MKDRLNGYWTSAADPSITIYIEKVYKKGYVTGYSYTKTEGGTIHGQFKASHDELVSGYKRKKM